MASTFKNTRKKWFYALVVIALGLILLRALAPYAVQYYVNQQLEQTQGITGHVGDVDLYLYRGAYAVDEV